MLRNATLNPAYKGLGNTTAAAPTERKEFLPVFMTFITLDPGNKDSGEGRRVLMVGDYYSVGQETSYKGTFVKVPVSRDEMLNTLLPLAREKMTAYVNGDEDALEGTKPMELHAHRWVKQTLKFKDLDDTELSRYAEIKVDAPPPQPANNPSVKRSAVPKGNQGTGLLGGGSSDPLKNIFGGGPR